VFRFINFFRCGCPEGFTLHLLYNECVDANECGSETSVATTPCGNARCQNTYGSFSCLCPAGYTYDHRRQICIQSAAGCSEAPCAFGCNPVGSTGKSQFKILDQTQEFCWLSNSLLFHVFLTFF
jgi:hypothetical protein